MASAAVEGRIVLTHDCHTVTGFASTRVSAGQPMVGRVAVDRQTYLGRILNDLEAMAAASEMDEIVPFVPSAFRSLQFRAAVEQPQATNSGYNGPKGRKCS